MKTYVIIELNGQTVDKRFDTIDDAVYYAEQQEKDENDTLDIYICDTEGCVESQTCTRNPYSGDFEYYTWGIFGYIVNEDGKVTQCETLAELINSEEEAREKAETIKEKFSRFDKVCVESYLQTISENIGDVDKSYIVYGENPD